MLMPREERKEEGRSVCRFLDDQRVRRGKILEALWPDIDPKEAGGYLNNAAYKLRAVLQPSKEQKKQTLLLTADHSKRQDSVLAGSSGSRGLRTP